MHNLHRFTILLSLFILFGWVPLLPACKKKETNHLAPCLPNYGREIKPIVMAKCALVGCHDDNSSVARFTIDSVVKNKADAGRIHSHVFELSIMPPQSAPQLTGEEKDKLKCWLDNDAPLN